MPAYRVMTLRKVETGCGQLDEQLRVGHRVECGARDAEHSEGIDAAGLTHVESGACQRDDVALCTAVEGDRGGTGRRSR